MSVNYVENNCFVYFQSLSVHLLVYLSVCLSACVFLSNCLSVCLLVKKTARLTWQYSLGFIVCLKYLLDGGLTDNMPVFDNDTITISPWAGEHSICPRDPQGQAFPITIFNTSFCPSTNNFFRFADAFQPPSQETLKNYCWQGHDDAIRFLSENGKYPHSGDEEGLRQACVCSYRGTLVEQVPLLEAAPSISLLSTLLCTTTQFLHLEFWEDPYFLCDMPEIAYAVSGLRKKHGTLNPWCRDCIL